MSFIENNSLPANFIKSYKWLNYLSKSKLFASIWSNYTMAKKNYNSNINEILTKWQTLYSKIIKKDINFEEIDKIAYIAIDEEEWKLFHNSLNFNVTYETPNFEQNITNFKDYIHTKDVLDHENDVFNNINILTNFISSNGHKTAINVIKILNDLCKLYKSRTDWCLANLHLLTNYSLKISYVLVHLDTEFLQLLTQSTELIDWLRENPDDESFRSNIEIALGKNEIETPIELWKDGRVDELILSQLGNVRSYLHDIIFRKSEYASSIDELILIFNNKLFYRCDEIIHLIKSLKTCNKYRIPLVELLNGDNSYTNKLIQMYNQGAKFIIEDKIIKLEYVNQRTNIIQSFGFSDLMDFQSQIVLSKIKKESETQIIVDKFIHQFADIQQLVQVLNKLSELGQDVDNNYSFILNEDTLNNVLLRYIDKLNSCVTQIEHIRNTYHNANYYNVQQLMQYTDFNNIKSWTNKRKFIRHIDNIDDFPQPESRHKIRLIHTGNDMYGYVLSEYMRINQIPDRECLFICSKDIIWDDMYAFLMRYIHGDGLYALMGIEKLSFEIQRLTTNMIMDNKSNNTLLILSSVSENQHMISHFSEYKSVSIVLPLGESVGHTLTHNYSNGIFVYSSYNSGSGKSFDIKNLNPTNYTNIQINSNISKLELINRINNEYKSGVLHLDLTDTVTFDDILFELIFFDGLIVGKHEFKRDINCCICIEISSQKLYETLTICKFLNNIVSQTKNFTYIKKHLDIIDDSAYDRLKSVYSALKYVKNGAFPNNFILLEIENDCYDLLLQYSNLNTSSSLWCIWNFINVLYWQLCEMHHPESLIYTMCMPDPTSLSDREIESKQKFKCEIVMFLIKTSREFATRQVHTSTRARIAACKIQGFQRIEFNSIWKRCAFDVDDNPCYKRENVSKNETYNFYLYYRQLEKSWVIDDVIEPIGSCYSRTINNSFNSIWLTDEEWQDSPTFKVKLEKNNGGYNQEAIVVTCDGDKKDLGNNGLYLRQPLEDNIEDKAHYIKLNPRRHILYRLAEKVWQITPTCADDAGAYALSATQNLVGVWKTVSKREEKNVKITLYTKQELYDIEKRVFDEELPENTLMKWNELNHECILFSNENHILYFLSLNMEKMRAQMHPSVMHQLISNKIDISKELDQLSDKFDEMITSITGLEKHDNVMSNFCLTSDSLMKLFAIYIRIKCKIPVILMGEAGIGKTHILTFLCSWLKIKLYVLDVHGGTSENDIIDLFTRASKSKSIVFLDEINTCAHMGLFSEIIIKHSINGQKIPDFVHIIAALNPYRVRTNIVQSTGLIYNANNTVNDPMKNLVYRVYPIPETIESFIFDFGSLTATTENLYIKTMMKNTFKEPNIKIGEKDYNIIEIVSDLICVAQNFIRTIEDDTSSVSLRDAKRCIDLISFFDNTDSRISIILSIAFAYYFRLPTSDLRHEFATLIVHEWFENMTFEQVVENEKNKFVSNFTTDSEIAMNYALSENLFTVTICILNKIPIFLVGLPGTSKTLTLQIIVSNLQGKKSINEFWRKYPTIHLFQYQCSPLSSSASIQQQFNTAKNYQIHCHDTITVLLLDEIGLAEYSPDLPLKILHGMLINPPIAIVGLSNWVLDAAKMNRAICIQRTQATEIDIFETGKQILGDCELLHKLSSIYHKIYTQQSQFGREFFGMRDYYSLIKQIKRSNIAY